MFWLIRAGAYALSSLVIYQFVQGNAGPAGMFPAGKPLTLDAEHGMIFGVCAGISNYTGIDPTVIRFAWAIAVLYRGIGIALYLLAFFIMPAIV